MLYLLMQMRNALLQNVRKFSWLYPYR